MTFRFNRWPRVGAAMSLTRVPLAALAASLAALLMLDASPASACSCAEPSEPDAALAGADVVFEGTPRGRQLVEADLGFPGYRGAQRFDFEVARYFKGQLGPSLSVYTVDQGSACGREYPLDEPHIIYARLSDSGLLTDFLCSNSHSSSFAGDSSVLGSGVAPDPSIVNEDDDLDVAPEAPGVASGIHHVPLDAEPEPSGCTSALALPPSPGSRTWPAVATGLALLAWRLRRRASR